MCSGHAVLEVVVSLFLGRASGEPIDRSLAASDASRRGFSERRPVERVAREKETWCALERLVDKLHARAVPELVLWNRLAPKTCSQKTRRSGEGKKASHLTFRDGRRRILVEVRNVGVERSSEKHTDEQSVLRVAPGEQVTVPRDAQGAEARSSWDERSKAARDVCLCFRPVAERHGRKRADS